MKTNPFSPSFTLLLGILMVLFILSGTTTPVYAATFVVNNTGDEGDANPGDNNCATSRGVCTLRAAIQENNGGSGGNTITVPSSYTIIVGSELLVTKSVTINGSSQSTTIIDGNNTTRVFKFQDNSGTHTVTNLTIRNGYFAYSGPYPKMNGGGGIFNEATLTLSNVTLSNNRGTQGGGIFNALAGGAADLTPPSLTLNNVTLSSNTATSVSLGEGGGGLFNGSLLSTNGVTITSNAAGYQGGGIYINSYFNVNLTNFLISNNTAIMGGGVSNEIDQLVSLNNGTISGNISNCCDNGQPSGGGGIVNYDGTMSLTDVTVSGNSATATGAYGGGIVNIWKMTLNRVTISGNRAQYGAGIYNGSGVSNSMTFTNTTISGNYHASPAAGGGGIWNTTNGNLTLASSTVTSNSAAQTGGIYNMASLVLRNSIVQGNSSTTGYPIDCGGSTISSSGYNLIGSTGGCNFSSSTGDLLNVSAVLGPLQNNGGATFTHALDATSPAINTGNPAAPGTGGNACPTTDQRGITRPQAGRCDIGAYEFNSSILTSLNPSTKRYGSSGFTLIVTGVNFQNGFIVQWDGSDRPTTFNTSTQMSAAISTSDLVTARTVYVRVRNPGDSSVSNSLPFVIFGPLYLPFVQLIP